MEKNNKDIEQQEKEDQKKDQRRNRRTAIIIGIILLTLLLCLRQCHSNQQEEAAATTEKTTFDLTEDGNSKEGEIEADTSIVDKLNEQVAQSMVNVSMNSNPTFVDGVGNVLITNSVENYNPQVVEIYYGEEKIYQSGVIPVGSNLESAALDVELPEGDYDCTAYFNSIDSESGELLGRVGINIKVTVK